MEISPFLVINHPCEATLQWIQEQLLRAGLRPVQTFDLRAARTGLPDCPCPNHGMNECDCQMVVMLVYGKAEGPVTLILHGNDGKTWLSLGNNFTQPTDESVRAAIEHALRATWL